MCDWLFCGGSSVSEEIQLQSDYSKKVTPLYKAIENHQWASVNHFIKTGYWKNTFFSDPVKPAIQAKTWMVRYDEGLANGECATKTTICLPGQRKDNITWKQLPMHAAIIYNAPAIIIQKLLNIYPGALKCSDNRGNLPIHLAFRHGSNDAVLALLLQEYAEGMNRREANGLLPTECATETPSPQPLRGALLKTAMSKEDMDRKYIKKKVQEERFYYDERPVTPHQGNLSKNRQQQDDNEQMELLNQQIESLRTSVDRVISKQENESPPTPVLDTAAEGTKRFSPKSPLSSSAMDRLQEMVSRTLAGPTAAQQLSPREIEEDGVTSPPVNVLNSPRSQADISLSMTQSLLDSPSHQTLPLHTQPTSTSNILNPIQPPPQQGVQPTQVSLPPILRNLSFNSMHHQHQQHQQQLNQLQMQQQQAHQSLRQTATFEESRQRLDMEVREMENKMAEMEFAMKEMHKREKTVRRELALTLKEVKHWKAQAKRAVTEEEKNRILTEMLHELVPSSGAPRTTPRNHNKTPRTISGDLGSNSEDASGQTPVTESDLVDEQEENMFRSRPRKAQSEIMMQPTQRRTRRGREDEQRKKHQSSRHYDDDRRDEMEDYGDHYPRPPPQSTRHSDVGAYNHSRSNDNLYFDRPAKDKDHGKNRHNDAAPKPVRRIQSERYQRQARPQSTISDADPAGFADSEYPYYQQQSSRRKVQSERNLGRGGGGPRRRIEPNARGGGATRRFADPQGVHVESESFIRSPVACDVSEAEDETEETEFSLSLVDKIASLQQSKQENEKYQTRNYRRAQRMVQQRRRDATEHGVWQSRDPEEAARARSPPPLNKKHAAYHRHARQTAQRQRGFDLHSGGASGSSSSNGQDYYVLE